MENRLVILTGNTTLVFSIFTIYPRLLSVHIENQATARMAAKIQLMPEKIRVVIVDDHQVIRTSWKILFGTDDRFEVVGVLKSGQEAIDQVPGLAPVVVLMDINMFPINGFETTEQLIRIDPAILVIGISANNYPGYAQKMMAIGAKGFVTKSSPFDELTRAVTTVNGGGTYICREITRLSEK